MGNGSSPLNAAAPSSGPAQDRYQDMLAGLMR